MLQTFYIVITAQLIINIQLEQYDKNLSFKSLASSRKSMSDSKLAYRMYMLPFIFVGLQLLGHVAASPQLRIHGTPSPHLLGSTHSTGSPAHHGLLTIDRPTSRESFSMTPPRAQVFPPATLQPELLKVLRPHPANYAASPNTLSIPLSSLNHSTATPTVSDSTDSSAVLQLAAMQHMQYLQAAQQQEQHAAALAANEQAMLHSLGVHTTQQPVSGSGIRLASPRNVPSPRSTSGSRRQHLQLPSQLSIPPVSVYNGGSDSNSLYPSYNNMLSADMVPDPSPHHELKILANIASSELGTLNRDSARNAVSKEQSSMMEAAGTSSRSRESHPDGVFNQRLQNLTNFTSYQSMHRTRSISFQTSNLSIVGANRSLDILRRTLQNDINTEMRAVLDKYIKGYFEPAVDNIRYNNGGSSLDQELISRVCRDILEEVSQLSSRSDTETPNLPLMPDNMSDVTSTTSEIPNSKLPFAKLKRPAPSDTESEGSSYKKGRKKGRKKGSLGPSGLTKSDAVRREGPRWNPMRFTTGTEFIMGSKANKALGLGNTRGRIYFKHPELFKYNSDSEDKMWLYEQHKMNLTGGKAYMMVFEDIVDLAQSHEYRNTHEPIHLKGFVIPKWMLEKVKAQMYAILESANSPSAPISTPPPSKSAKMKPVSTLVHQEQYDGDSDKNLPFKSVASSRKSLSDSKLGVNSPANTEEMELLSSEEQEEPTVSPFGSAEDYYASPMNAATAQTSSIKSANSPMVGNPNLMMNLTSDRLGIS
ncbi:DNTTIP1 [Bugula neritina]|uniref:DNTTIP1 n=1 Tax=Bugula neritina TaxID=10212 RepID=A0A7J7IZ31_BUGNE|nr:DNTTIP1 [Bugula neritina]